MNRDARINVSDELEKITTRQAMRDIKENVFREKIRKVKGGSNCACDPENLKMCMWHLPLDEITILRAIRESE